MGEDSKIEWTDHTFNPWLGCEKVSPGCDHCYAEVGSRRLGAQHGLKLWEGDRYRTGDGYWTKPLAWNRKAAAAGVRAKVFCASHADVFEDREDHRPARARLAGVVRETPWLDWLFVTKRPQNANRLWLEAWIDSWTGAESYGTAWAPNVWLGATVEDMQRADERIPHLLKVPARMRFLSCEPLLSEVQLGVGGAFYDYGFGRDDRDEPRIHWVIVGGESGHGARPLNPSWVKSIVNVCAAAGVPCFVKQLGANVLDFNGRIKHPKGGDIAEWPEDLRVREFPEARP